MPTIRTSISADTDTRDRLAALSAQVEQPVSEVLRTLSHASVGDLLRCAAVRALAEKGGAS